MDQKKAIVLGVGILAALGLLAIVYSQLSPEKDLADLPSVPSQSITSRSGENVLPVANPKTATEVSAAIDAQLSEDAKAIDAEVAAETADIEAEINSMNELSQSYDENEL